MARFCAHRQASLQLENSALISLKQFRCPARPTAGLTHRPRTSHRQQHVGPILAAARRGRFQDEDRVIFDGEDEWDDETSLQSRPFLQQTFRMLGLVTDRLTDITLQFAPEDASPQVVRTAVSGGLILLAFSFVKGILSFILTIGTIVLGAYVAVRVFGLDVGGMDSGKKSRGKGKPKRRGQITDGKGKNSLGAVSGLLSVFTGSDSEEDSGLLDVWFEKKGKNSKSR